MKTLNSGSELPSAVPVQLKMLPRFGFYGHGILLLPFCHLHPVIMLGGHDVERFTHYGYGENRHDDGDGAVAGITFL